MKWLSARGKRIVFRVCYTADAERKTLISECGRRNRYVLDGGARALPELGAKLPSSTGSPASCATNSCATNSDPTKSMTR